MADDKSPWWENRGKTKQTFDQSRGKVEPPASPAPRLGGFGPDGNDPLPTTVDEIREHADALKNKARDDHAKTLDVQLKAAEKQLRLKPPQSVLILKPDGNSYSRKPDEGLLKNLAKMQVQGRLDSELKDIETERDAKIHLINAMEPDAPEPNREMAERGQPTPEMGSDFAGASPPPPPSGGGPADGIDGPGDDGGIER